MLGQSGQLASELRLTTPALIQLKVLSYAEFSALSDTALNKLFFSINPVWVINAAAYNQVDQAELFPELALAGNFYLVQRLQRLCALTQSKLLHISTDYVFDGLAKTPYKEQDQAQPLNQYGKSKRAAELWLLQEYADSSVIIRTSWLYSAYGTNFVKTMLQLMQTKPQVKLVQNQLGSPCGALGLAQVIWQIVSGKAVNSGVYHWADAGYCSRYQFAREIQAVGLELGLLQQKAELLPVAAKHFALSAVRPAFSALDSSALRQLLLLPTVSWQQQLALVLRSFSVIKLDKLEKD
ncbi:dTDP-4-dehydrorhamnose reductase [Rheinheimera sp. MM224]|nr:dTDP-4-dehydrorhamnose reductase [Rheinheimera sp. MM224]